MIDEIPLRSRRIARDKLQLFLPNHELVKAFEALNVDVIDTLPEAIYSALQDANSASAQAASALDQLSRIADALELLALAPVAVPALPVENLDCPHCATTREELAALAQRVAALELAP